MSDQHVDHKINYPLYYQDLKPIQTQFEDHDRDIRGILKVVLDLEKRVGALEKLARQRSDEEVMKNL